VETKTTDVSQDSPVLDASPDVAAPSAATGTATPQGDSPEGVISQPSDQTKIEVDPLEGVPTLEELQGKEGVPYAKAVAQLRGVYEPLKQQHDELATKYSVFEPVADRFQTAEEVTKLVSLNESLNKYSPDPDSGALRPDPTGFAQQISTDDPERADYLTSALVWGQTKHPATGQPVTRAELVLQVMANDPQLRSRALQVLGGVEPSAVPAPVYYPTQEELDNIAVDPTRLTAEDHALQETYKRLPYEKREVLAGMTPDYVRSELKKEQLIQQLTQERTQREESDRQAEIQATQRVEQEANDAGEQYVEQGFKGTFTNFANHIYETWKPTDNPEVNRREGGLVALAVAALSHPDTRFAAEATFKDMGIDQKTLDEFNAAREAYAQSGREFGYLSHKNQRPNGDPARIQQKLLAKAKDLGTLIIAGRNEYFKTRATTHNDKLDQTERARIPVGAGVVAAGANGQPARHRWADLE
jgi:hypothetical protein